MDTSGNTIGWNGNVDDLPDDTLVTVRLGDIRNRKKRIDATFELMKLIGETGKRVFVRYDPLRTYNGKFFTVVIDDPDLPEGNPNKTWRIDTDNPVKGLYIYIEERV